MVCYYMAIDIDEEGGRQVLGYIEDEKLKLEEVHRFELQHIEKDGELYWNFEHIFHEIKIGLIKCREVGKLPVFVGVDGRSRDFVLLDEEDRVIEGTGLVLKEGHSTLDQLRLLKEQHPEKLGSTMNMLMVPNYFIYLLSGFRSCEYTNALASQLLHPAMGEWDDEVIERLGIERNAFPRISWPGSICGSLRIAVTEEIGYDCILVQPVTVNTSSAVLAFPPELGYKGPVKASAIGNILVLMISGHQLKDLQEARECVKRTFEININ